MSESIYAPRHQSRSSMHQIRRMRYHVREWGDPSAPLLVMVHGWMDVSASFQFLVDHLASDWHVVAPDWRGFGETQWTHADSYWIPDYLADLDTLLDMYSPEEPVRIVGHSLGGNVVSLYAGVRPERIRSFVNLEGLGLIGDGPDQAPLKLAKWLAEIKNPPTLSTYTSLEAVAARLQKTNPRLTDARAQFLALHWSKVGEDGRFEILGDPLHKVSNPIVYRADEAQAIWARIAAPVLWVMARQSAYALKMDAAAGYSERIASIARVSRTWIDDAGHMIHHDQPEKLAIMIEQFLLRCDTN